MHIAQKMVFVYSILGFSILQNAMYFVIQTTHFVNEIHISFCDTMHNDIFKKKIIKKKLPDNTSVNESYLKKTINTNYIFCLRYTIHQKF